MRLVCKHWASQTPQLHVYSLDHLCELHPYVLYFKRPFQLLLSFHSEIPFKSGLRACVFFFNPHIVTLATAIFSIVLPSGYPVPHWNTKFWCVSKCRALCDLTMTTWAHFHGGQRWAKRKQKKRTGDKPDFCKTYCQVLLEFRLTQRRPSLVVEQQWVATPSLPPFLYEAWANY